MTDINANEPTGGVHQPEVHIHNDGNGRVFDILATLLACGAIGMLAWAVAQSSLEIAASGATVFFWWTGTQMIKNGMVTLPAGRKSEDKDIEEAKGTIATLFRGGKAMLRRAPKWQLVIFGFLFMCGYLAMRYALVLSLGFFANPWVAGAAAAGFASLVIGWTKLVEMVKRMNDRGARA